MPEADPTIDIESILFPSDRLTVADLRRLLPYERAFEYGTPEAADAERTGRAFGIGIIRLIDMERALAETCFYGAVGLPVPDRIGVDGDELRGAISSLYVKLGITSGDHEARELVRDLERQAAQQAERLRGQNR